MVAGRRSQVALVVVVVVVFVVVVVVVVVVVAVVVVGVLVGATVAPGPSKGQALSSMTPGLGRWYKIRKSKSKCLDVPWRDDRAGLHAGLSLGRNER